jgi:hypothetical protein
MVKYKSDFYNTLDLPFCLSRKEAGNRRSKASEHPELSIETALKSV